MARWDDNDKTVFVIGLGILGVCAYTIYCVLIQYR